MSILSPEIVGWYFQFVDYNKNLLGGVVVANAKSELAYDEVNDILNNYPQIVMNILTYTQYPMVTIPLDIPLSEWISKSDLQPFGWILPLDGTDD